MESLKKEVNMNFLEESLEEALKDKDFVGLVNSLELDKKTLLKNTSKLENTVSELHNCANCKGIFMCSNAFEGHVSTPKKNNDNLYFTYKPCKYLRKINEEKHEKELLEKVNDLARMKDIDGSDKKRVKAIVWLDTFYENYSFKNKAKGLYLYGNFGCGKTFLISALFNELNIKKNVKCEIIYFPEILRDLKNNWDLYEEKMNLYQTVDLLCIDDIGAENVTSWSRDEVLGTILQTRMTKNKTTFFTSNLTLDELENHFKLNNSLEEQLKSRRIMERIKQLSFPLELISTNRRG